MVNINENQTLIGSIASRPILDGIKQKNASKLYGFQFPFRRTSAGYFSKSSDVDVVRSNITQLIRTEPGERVMQPDFGCPLKSLLFENITPELLTEVRERIAKAVRKFLPSVRILSLQVGPLDEYGSNGIPTIKILLVCKIVDVSNSIFDVKVSI